MKEFYQPVHWIVCLTENCTSRLLKKLKHIQIEDFTSYRTLWSCNASGGKNAPPDIRNEDIKSYVYKKEYEFYQAIYEEAF